MVEPDKTLDVKGLVPPRPTIITCDTLEKMSPGQVLRVITNNMTTKETIPSMCAERGYQLIDIKEEAGKIYFIIRK